MTARPDTLARDERAAPRPVPPASSRNGTYGRPALNPQFSVYRDPEPDPFHDNQRSARYEDAPPPRYDSLPPRRRQNAQDGPYEDTGFPSGPPRRGYQDPGYDDPRFRDTESYGRPRTTGYGNRRPGLSPEYRPDPEPFGDGRPNQVPGAYPGGRPPSRPARHRPDDEAGRKSGRKVPLIVGGAVVVALVATGGAILVPKLTSSVGPGCKAYAGPALTAYNQTITDLNARAPHAKLTADMTAAIKDLTSAAGQAQSTSVKSALDGLLGQLNAVKSDVGKGSVPASAVRSLNKAANAADSAC